MKIVIGIISKNIIFIDERLIANIIDNNCLSKELLDTLFTIQNVNPDRLLNYSDR